MSRSGATGAKATTGLAQIRPVGCAKVTRRRVSYWSERAVSASTPWFDGVLAEVAPKPLVPEQLKEGTPRYLEE